MQHFWMLPLFILAGPGDATAQDLTFFTFGAGDVTGGYYASATAICDEVNQQANSDLRCSPDPTTGSIYNLDALRRGELDFALVQSDWQRRAYEGTGAYSESGPMTDLRSVMGLYQESLTILARRDAGITSLADLVGKRVDIGHPASGRRGTVDEILLTLGYEYVDFATLGEYPAGVALDSICAGSIDATLLIVGHPNAAVAQALAECDAVLVPVSAAESEAILLSGADMRRSFILPDTYPQLESGIMTVAVTATVVTRADVDSDIVAALVASTVENFAILGRKAPVLAGVDLAEMRSMGLTAPLHDGATSAFDAAGMLP